MATAKAIDALIKDPERVCRLAVTLAALADTDFTTWEDMFLESMARTRAPDRAISQRQAEILLDLQDKCVLVERVEGLSVAALIRACWLLRGDLDVEDAQWLDELHRRQARALRRGAVRRLLALIRQVDRELLPGFLQVEAAA